MTNERYNRQVLLPFIGELGQEKINNSKAVIIGCGALGTVISSVLVRAGVGEVVVIDRDFVELSNLQRQTLYDEQDVKDNLPKAIASERKLRLINSDIKITGIVSDVNSFNIEKLVDGANVVVDGSDNFEIRFLINDICIKKSIPWIYGAAVGTTGMSMTIIPGRTPCLRCVYDGIPPPGMVQTCDTAGVLGSNTGLIGNYQATEALKIILGKLDVINTRLFSIDLWSGEVNRYKISKSKELGNCSCCKHNKFEFLDGSFSSTVTSLCGRNAVQINSINNGNIKLEEYAERLGLNKDINSIFLSKFLLKFSIGCTHDVTLFPDARAIIKGTNKVSEARSIYSKYIGN